MPSNNVVKNLDTGQNRFKLCHQAFSAVRKQLDDDTRARNASYDGARSSDPEHHEFPGTPEGANGIPLEGSEQPPVIVHPEGPSPAQAGETLASQELHPVEAPSPVLSEEL